MQLLNEAEVPLLSVWMVTYNHEHFIRQSLESVVMQKTTFPIEVVIGEDCSSDGTRKIVQEFEERYPHLIKPVYHDKNVGAYRNAYEFCYPRLRGKYIACLEGDDYWTDPEKLQKQVEFLEGNPEYSISFHMALVLDEATKKKLHSNKNQKQTSTLEDLFIGNFISTATCVFRNGLITELPEFFPKTGSNDWILHILNARHGKIHFMEDLMAVYRLHAGGAIANAVSSYNNLKKALQRDIFMFESLDGHFNYEYHQYIKKQLAKIYKRLSTLEIEHNNRAEAIAATKNSLKAHFKLSTAALLLPMSYVPNPGSFYKMLKSLKGQRS